MREDRKRRLMTIDKVTPHRYHPKREDVRLLPGTPFYDRQQEMLEFLLAQDNGSMLYNFRKAAGLPTGDAEPMTGWDADECKLKGHTTGHYLSALSLAYAATGDERFARKAAEIIDGFAECQDAFAKSGKVKPGFLSAYDEEQFDLLEKFTKYPDIWAPYYTLDKIMAGLLDAYELMGNEQALAVLDPLGDWIYERLSKVPQEDRTKMWSMYIAGEYGAMIGTLVRLYRITGKQKHLDAARLFENDGLFTMMAEGRDGLDTMHANQHIPQIIGAMELYAATGEQKYLDIGRNFVKIVIDHHCYSIGGVGEQERFHEADSECNYLTDKTAESCPSVNMLRLTSKVLEYADGSFMDYYERTLFNHILMSHSHSADGGTTYFMPLAPGSVKHYETEENSCCHGSGMESRFRYMTDIFSYDDQCGILRVDLPVSSILDGEEKVKVEFSDTGDLTVTALADMKGELEVRIPKWAVKSGSYISLGRLKEGESVTLHFPMELRVIEANPVREEIGSGSEVPQSGNYFSLAWGPYLLAAVSDQQEFISLDPLAVERDECDDEIFRAGETILKPLYMIDEEHYHVYFRHFDQ